MQRAHLPRSCMSCAKSKVRCDKIAPRCSTCATKNLDCQYPTNSSGNDEPEILETSAQVDLQHAPSVVPSHVGFRASLEPESIVASRSTGAVSQIPHSLELQSVRDEAFDWNLLDALPASLPTQEAWPSGNDQVTLSVDFNNISISADVDVLCLQNHLIDNQLMSTATDHLPMTSLPTFSSRFLQTRPKFRTSGQMTANNMARILCSYPKMLLDFNNSPPFIHPQWISASSSDPALEPLGNCLSLLGMLNTRARGTASLFWRNVRMECDRLSSTYTTLNNHAAIAAIQALLVYMLIRVAEGETEHNNHDAALLGTLTLILQVLSRRPRYDSFGRGVSVLHNESTWSNWIFEESHRRVAAIFRIINMLVCVSPAPTCASQPGLLIAPLPARKQLWEALSEEQWLGELQRVPMANSGLGLAYTGDMIGLDEYKMKLLTMPGSVEPCTSPKSKENWEQWCLGMDGFGALIMLAASLPM